VVNIREVFVKRAVAHEEEEVNQNKANSSSSEMVSLLVVNVGEGILV